METEPCYNKFSTLTVFLGLVFLSEADLFSFVFSLHKENEWVYSDISENLSFLHNRFDEGIFCLGC